MNLIEFFGLKVKPKIAKGKYLTAPLENSQIAEGIFAVRDKDVNAFVIKRGDSMIAIDCGYKNCQKVSDGLKELGIDEDKVTHLFLTHLDLDHAGGVDCRCNRVFKSAQIYFGEVEGGYLKRKLFRKRILGIGLQTPIKLNEGYTLLSDNQVVNCGEIKVQAILCGGHTMGHLCYLIDDKYLFTGDSLILVKGEGYAFYKLWNVNTPLAIQSLQKLKTLTNVKMVITSHSGFTADISSAFSHINKVPNRKAKGFKVSDNALYNPYI